MSINGEETFLLKNYKELDYKFYDFKNIFIKGVDILL